MELFSIGSGNAFTKKNWQSNFLIRQNNKWLLIDCGSYTPIALLEEFNLTMADIDAVYISHIHADHVNALEELAYCTYFNPSCKKPTLYCQGQYIIGTDGEAYASGLINDLWKNSLRGGLSGLEHVEARLHTYFDVVPVEENSSFTWEGIKFDMVQTVHVSARYKIENSYGLMWTDPDTSERVYITTDTQFCPINAMMAYLKEVDVVYHDCETSPFASNVHSHYERLRELPAEIKSKMWLYHYHDNVIDKWSEWSERARMDGFRGFVKTGAIFSRSYMNQESGSIGKSLYAKIKRIEDELTALKSKVRDD